MYLHHKHYLWFFKINWERIKLYLIIRAEASYGFECYFKEQLAEKKKGRNHDLSVTEYKVAQESRKLADIKQQNNEE